MGVIVLEAGNCGLLLGMDYLRKANRALMVPRSKGVLLVENKNFDEAAGAAGL
jgi:hypothetical protein